MAFSSQRVALGLHVSFIQYDLIVLQKTSSVAGSLVGWNVPNRRSHIVVLMPKFTSRRCSARAPARFRPGSSLIRSPPRCVMTDARDRGVDGSTPHHGGEPV